MHRWCAHPLVRPQAPGYNGVPADAVIHYKGLWAGMLAALSRALASCAAVTKAERAAAAQGVTRPYEAAIASAAAAAERAEAASGDRGAQGGVPVVWDLSTAAIVQLALRWEGLGGWRRGGVAAAAVLAYASTSGGMGS